MNRCIACNSVLSNKLLEFANMPRAAQHIPEEKDLSSETGLTLSLYECPYCGLVQFDAPPVAYYKDVIRATGVSDKFKALRIEQYKKLIDRFHLTGKRIIEIGSGGGEFLQLFEGLGIEAFGLEHSHELVMAAQKKGLHIIEGFIEDENDILCEELFDAFVSFNFLEHQPNPVGMLKGIAANLKDKGVGLLTVPSFDFFQEQASYYEFLRDHIAYYTADSLKRLMEICGFDVISTDRFNGDTLEVIVQKRASIQMVDYFGQKECLEIEINSYLDSLKSENEWGGEVYVWGASHQAFTVLSTLCFSIEVCAVIDSAEFKWGKYTPATHIPIVSPEILRNTIPECIIIIAPGFSDEIYNTIKKLAPDVRRVITIIDGHAILLK